MNMRISYLLLCASCLIGFAGKVCCYQVNLCTQSVPASNEDIIKCFASVEARTEMNLAAVADFFDWITTKNDNLFLPCEACSLDFKHYTEHGRFDEYTTGFFYRNFKEYISDMVQRDFLNKLIEKYSKEANVEMNSRGEKHYMQSILVDSIRSSFFPCGEPQHQPHVFRNYINLVAKNPRISQQLCKLAALADKRADEDYAKCTKTIELCMPTEE